MGLLQKQWRSQNNAISWLDLSIENYTHSYENIDSYDEATIDTVFIFKGDALVNIGLFNEALEYFERSILEKSLTPKDEAWFGKGFVFQAMR